MRVVLVPGFSQTARSWDRVRAALAAEPRLDVVALDVPDGLDFGGTAAALGDAGGEALYVGYSMGGRLALALAIDRPDLVEGLMLVSASPGIADDDERAARAAADDELARGVERDGVEAFLDRWLAQPLFATLPRDPHEVAARVAGNTVERLAHQLTALGQGAMPPRWDALEDLDVPVALVTGEADAKYEAIADAVFEQVDDCVHWRLPGGHALPLEQPDALADLIVRFAHDVASDAAETE